MKWRIKDGELRIRISPKDKEMLKDRDGIYLKCGPIVLNLSLREGTNASFQLNENTMTCYLPKSELRNWLSSDALSWKTNDQGCGILIEKDLSCSHTSEPLNEKLHFGHKFD